MKNLAAALAFVFVVAPAAAQESIKMNFVNEDITKILEVYSKATGEKFVIDPSVRGKVTLLLPEPVAKEEAFNQLSSALAVNGYGLSKQGDTHVVMSARNIQRNLVEVTRELPALKPERMTTWIVTLRHIPAGQVNREIRTLSSKDGEMVVNSAGNQLIFTDWVSNLHRISAILKEIDRPADAAVAKIVSEARKESEREAKNPKSQKQNEKRE